MRTQYYVVALWVLGALVLGSMWQIEITILNQLNGDYPFGYLFTWIQGVNNWAARDFFFTVIAVCFIATVGVAYELGKTIARNAVSS